MVTGLVPQPGIWLFRSWDSEKPDLLGGDGVHLLGKGNRFFNDRLARLMKRSLN